MPRQEWTVVPDTHEAIIRQRGVPDRAAAVGEAKRPLQNEGPFTFALRLGVLRGLRQADDFLQKILWQELCADLLWLLPLWGVPKAYHG